MSGDFSHEARPNLRLPVGPALGLLETNYFSRENFVLPLTAGHFWLVSIAFIEYLILALIQSLLSRGSREKARAERMMRSNGVFQDGGCY